MARDFPHCPRQPQSSHPLLLAYLCYNYHCLLKQQDYFNFATMPEQNGTSFLSSTPYLSLKHAESWVTSKDNDGRYLLVRIPVSLGEGLILPGYFECPSVCHLVLLARHQLFQVTKSKTKKTHLYPPPAPMPSPQCTCSHLLPHCGPRVSLERLPTFPAELLPLQPVHMRERDSCYFPIPSDHGACSPG